MDAWKRCIELADVLCAMGSLNARQKDGMEKALLLCEGVAVATDRMQGDTASAVVLLKVPIAPLSEPLSLSPLLP